MPVSVQQNAMSSTEPGQTPAPVAAQTLSPLPSKGTWVADLGDSESASRDPRVARVLEAFRDTDGLAFLDLSMYSVTGESLGRTTLPMRGRTGFESCCNADWWVPIEKPKFRGLAKARLDGKEVRNLLVLLKPLDPAASEPDVDTSSPTKKPRLGPRVS